MVGQNMIFRSFKLLPPELQSYLLNTCMCLHLFAFIPNSGKVEAIILFLLINHNA
jgi:hypothetical protein